MSDETKPCPGCREAIKAEAIICRFCHYDLRTGAVAPPVQPAAAPRRSSAVVWVVLLVLLCGGGVVVVPIVAAIAIPGFLAASRAANEREASAFLKTLTTAEADFRANDRDGNNALDFYVADVRGLYYTTAPDGSQIRLIVQTVAEADANGAAVPRAGYLYSVIARDETGALYDSGAGRHDSKFALCAYPHQYPSSGRLTFIVDEGNVVWKKDTRGVRADQWPSDPAAEGWSKLD